MILLYNATLVTADREDVGAVLIDGEDIHKVYWKDEESCTEFEGRKVPFEALPEYHTDSQCIDLTGKHIIAGGIDAHVHFREPGLTHKADISTESRAAVAGGVTSVFDMPNTSPATISAEALAGKIRLSEGRSLAKIGFHIGASNSNADEICRLVREGDETSGLKASDIPGVKVFMGSSTGNMLVDDGGSLDRLFAIKGKPVLVHCEDEAIIRGNMTAATEKYGEDIPFQQHEFIRSRQACIRSSIKALELAMKHGTNLVLCHISTKEELNMVQAAKAINPSIIAETSCNYLWFSNEDYNRLGSRVKCNPSVKTAKDREALIKALAEGVIDTIGSDHAPHLLSEKDGKYKQAPSGLPTIQQSLPVLLTIAYENEIPLTRITSVFSEKAGELYGLNRGKIEKGYEADLVVFDYNKTFEVKQEDQKGKCGWTPYEGETLRGEIKAVYIDGNKII